MFECICGYKGNSSHSKSCDEYEKEVFRVNNSIKSYLKEIYLETVSVSECCEIVKRKEKTLLSTAKIRKLIDLILKDLGIKQNLSNKELNAKRQQKMQKTMFDRYGVTNNGQRLGQGWNNLNSIEYTKLDLDTALTDFRKNVNYLTRKHVERLKKQGLIPTKCYYTDITFKDELQKNVNPNDPYKRSVDHRVPVIEMFLQGYTPEEVCKEENIVFCLRTVNTYKANTPEEYFVEKLVPYLKENL
jgi:hypothetical protein